jgi:hypothetical protein
MRLAHTIKPSGSRAASLFAAAGWRRGGNSGSAAALVFFLFDLLYLDGEDVSARR